MGRRFANILETIGRTPVVKIEKFSPPGVELFVKVEAFNPLGSVKDRLALGVIEAAERSGALKPGQTVIEATSGNTGIGLAMVCAQKGYPLVVTMAESFSVERRKLMRFLGARVVLTPAAERGTGMLGKAMELAEKHGWFLCRQFDNEANPDFHSKTTAVEILDDFADTGLDYWVTGTGTGGTLKGVARVLKKNWPNTKVVVCEPDNAQILASGIRQRPVADGQPPKSHPLFRPHPMQGWTPDFIPKLAEDAVDAGLIDEIVPIAGADALRLSRELACKEGIFTGISGGATLAGALAVCAKAPPGSKVLCMLPDTGERYLSTPLFADIAAEMTEEEVAIAQSTPRYRFDVQSPAPVANGQPVRFLTAEAETFVAEAIADRDKPVVMFGMEWCEFCWSVRRLFEASGIPYRTIALDSVDYRKDDWGGRIRIALRERIGAPTIPQIFVGGDAHWRLLRDLRRLQRRPPPVASARQQRAVRGGRKVDAYGFLPDWLHPR